MNHSEFVFELPRDPVFAEPWQAEAFAMTVSLHEYGIFTWPEWAAALSAQVKIAGASASGDDYYQHWLAALEDLVTAKGLSRTGELHDLTEAWQRAAHATPHGAPVRLENDPQQVGAAKP